MCELRIDTDDDGRMRLAQSIVMWGDRPVYIEQASKALALIRPLDDNELVEVALKDLDLTPVQVGNMVIGNKYLYIQRAPVRKWKQGLNGGNIKKGDMPWDMADRFQLQCTGMLNAIIGKYPSVQDAIRWVLEGRKKAVPISRHWGFGDVDGMARVLYKDKMVGFLEDDGEIIISKKYFFLKEDLLEALNVR